MKFLDSPITSYLLNVCVTVQVLEEVERRREISPALVQPFMRSVMEAPFPAPGRTITVKSFLPGSGNEVGSEYVLGGQRGTQCCRHGRGERLAGVCVCPAGVDAVSACGFTPGARALPEPAPVPQCGSPPAGVCLPAAGEEGDLHRR